jgi:hypothetical protein
MSDSVMNLCQQDTSMVHVSIDSNSSHTPALVSHIPIPQAADYKVSTRGATSVQALSHCMPWRLSHCVQGQHSQLPVGAPLCRCCDTGARPLKHCPDATAGSPGSATHRRHCLQAKEVCFRLPVASQHHFYGADNPMGPINPMGLMTFYGMYSCGVCLSPVSGSMRLPTTRSTSSSAGTCRHGTAQQSIHQSSRNAWVHSCRFNCLCMACTAWESFEQPALLPIDSSNPAPPHVTVLSHYLLQPLA